MAPEKKELVTMADTRKKSKTMQTCNTTTGSVETTNGDAAWRACEPYTPEPPMTITRTVLAHLNAPRRYWIGVMWSFLATALMMTACFLHVLGSSAAWVLVFTPLVVVALSEYMFRTRGWTWNGTGIKTGFCLAAIPGVVAIAWAIVSTFPQPTFHVYDVFGDERWLLRKRA